MSEPRRIDLPEITLAWGDATAWKRQLRDESRVRFADRPPSERLRLALEMVVRAPRPGHGAPG